MDECLNHPWLCPSRLTTPYSEPPCLYTLPESDSGECGYSPDSAYSSDSNNGSPTFLDQNNAESNFTSTLNVSSLCRCPIPEEQQQQQLQLQQEHQTNEQISLMAATSALLSSGKRLRGRGSCVSVDMEENLKAVRRQQQRSARRASLVIDDPRHTSTIQVIDDRRLYERLPRSKRGMCNHQSLLNLNHELLDNRMSINNEYNKASNNRLRHAESFDCGIGGNLYDMRDYSCQLNQSLSNIDFESITGISKPWQKLCNGSVLRAVSQLTHKNSPKKKKLSQSKTDINNSRTDNNNSRTEIISNMDNRTPKKAVIHYTSDGRGSKTDIRASRNDLRSPKSELRNSKSDLRASKHDLRGSKHDIRGSKQDIRVHQNDFRGSITEIKSPKSELRSSKTDLRRSKTDLRSNHNLGSWNTDLALSRLDMSLSRLDLAHEQLDREEELEQADTVRGDLTLPRRRINRPSLAPLLRNNALHMSFRVSKSSREHC